MIEVILDELKDYFKDEGFKVDFEIIDDLSTYVHFQGYHDYTIDNFYKKVTNVTNKFSREVASLSEVDIVIMDGSLYLLISVENPK